MSDITSKKLIFKAIIDDMNISEIDYWASKMQIDKLISQPVADWIKKKYNVANDNKL